ncbi:MAG: GspH/FimT family pseudopilin [Gammaproteobacteria bacterium]|nr:GspH/FimT family pseudopilin [Gammaproteobacteria bacterium]
MNQAAFLKPKHLAGFTIVELMLTIVVAAVILSIGVPSFQGLMERNQLTSSINEFISSLTLARSEAIRRNSPVALCASADGENCGGAGYEVGWIVYVNENSDGDRDAGEELLWVHDSLPASLTLRGTGCCINNIPYLASGRVSGINGSVNLCKDNDLGKSKKITIITSGRVRLNEGATNDCAT